MSDYVYGENTERDYPGVKVSIERITPKVAEMMLEHNTHNRKLSQSDKSDSKRNQFVIAMKDDAWDLNGSTVVFSDKGVLVDGQHRLMACKISGHPFTTVVVRGVRMAGQVTVDAGHIRTPANVLQIDGYKAANQLAASGKVLMKLHRVGFDSAFSSHSLEEGFTRVEHIAFCEKSRRLSSCTDHCKAGKFGKYATVTLYTVFLYLFGGISEEDCDFFFEDFDKDYPERGPIRLLKTRLINDKLKTRPAYSRADKAAMTIKAWNAFRRGDELKELRFRRGGAHPEDFPIPDGFDKERFDAEIEEAIHA